MSVLENWIWYPETPASVPAGARISAGKSGNVLMSLPTRAEVSVNCVPASCIPSPESPAKRIVTLGSFVSFFVPVARLPGGMSVGVIALIELFEPRVGRVAAEKPRAGGQRENLVERCPHVATVGGGEVA